MSMLPTRLYYVVWQGLVYLCVRAAAFTSAHNKLMASSLIKASLPPRTSD